MRRPFWFVGLSLVAAATVGCAGVKGPNLFHPGTVAKQQAQAQRFDPLPSNDAGPAVTGARPRDSQIEAPEPVRARWPVPGVRPE
jgi:hypothetical protein